MRRLYHQFYLTIVASLVAVVLAAGALWRFAPSETPADQAFEMAGELLAAHLARRTPGWRRSSRQSTGYIRGWALISVSLPTTASRWQRRELPYPLLRRGAKAEGGFTAEVVRLGPFDCRTRVGS